MTIVAEIAGLHLQPIAIPVGWMILRNSFFSIDPDEDLSNHELVFHPGQPTQITDPWDDVVWQYFDCSYHWIAMRTDNLREITLDYPMGVRDEEFRLREYHHQPVKFDQTPKQRIKRNFEDTKLIYELQPPIEEADRDEFDNPDREFCSKKRLEVVAVLEQWLVDGLW
ncbi:MAG: hypothetical protein AAFP90_14455 [Planctomycetota bacterium]